MRILMTGGAGYLGSFAAPLLLSRGHEIRIFDRFCFGEEPVDPLRGHPGCEIIQGDIRRLQEAPGLLDGVDAVLHMAGLVNEPSCAINAEMAHDVNVESTRELAMLASNAGVSRFVLASTCSVYGQGVFDVLDEASAPNPVTLYGETKRDAEQVVLGMNHGRFEPLVGRLGSVFGVSPRMRFDLAVNQMVATAVREQRINVYGGGRQHRSFVHIADACRAFAMLLEAPAELVRGQVFNVGDDRLNLRVADLAERIASLCHVTQLDYIQGDEETRSYQVDFTKVRECLGFACEHSLESGVEECLEMLADPALDPFAEDYFNVKRMRRLISLPTAAGGEPIVPRFIPLYVPTLGEEEEQAVLEAMRGGWLTSGPKLKQFEAAFAAKLQAPYAIGCVSCTAALHLCLVHLGLQPGDEVITSPITWASTANTMVNMGVRPVFADVDRATMNIDPAAVERAITARTKAIMPVHLTGQPCDLDAIQAIAEQHGIPVIEDAAHALGAAYKNKPIGAISPFTCFSFYAIKNITTMEGGMVTCHDEEMAHHLRLLATNGMTATAWDRYGRSAAPAPPTVAEPGYKYLMGNVNAAMGLAQLKKLDEFQAARRRLARMYRRVLEEVDELELPQVRADVDHAWHLMAVKLRLDKLARTRDEISQMLRQENVGTSVHFYGLHLHPYYRKTLGYAPEDLPNATELSERMLSLPLFPRMSDKQLNGVVEALKKVLHYAKERRPHSLHSSATLK